MSDYSELKRLAEAALNDNGDYVALSDYGMAVPPAVVLDLIAEVEALRSQVATLQSDANSWQSGYDEGRRMGTKTALDEREQLRREIASLKPYPVRTDKTTIGYTGCIICGQYTDHGGLQCPNLAARSLSMENQRIVPVEPIRLDHPLDAAMRQGAKP